jgi:hypothetical protein
MSVTSVAAFPGGTPLTGAVGISSGNPYINVSTDVTGGKNNVQLSYVNTGFSAFATSPATEQITGGLLTFAGAGGTTVGIDNLANTLTITGGGGGGGNWSYKGAWAASNAYSINDVVVNPIGGQNAYADAVMYITSSNIPASSNAPWTSAGQTAGWQPIGNNLIVGFNNGSNASDPSFTTQLAMNDIDGSPPPTSSSGFYIMSVVNNDGDVYTDFGAGRFVVAGINSGLTPASGNTLPYITTQNPTEGITLEINGGGATAPPVNIVASGINLNGDPIYWRWRRQLVL